MKRLKSLIFNHWSLVIIILIIAVFLRLYNITEAPPGLYPDEAMNGNNALEALATGNFKIFYPENNGREGLFINIQAVFLKFLIPLFGEKPEPWMLRIPSALFGIFTVLGVYLFTKELFARIKNSKLTFLGFLNNKIQNENSKLKINEKIALFSAFFLATSFWHILFSRIGFRAIMAPMFLVWGLYFLLTSLNKIKISADTREEIKREEIKNQKSKIKTTNQNSKIILTAILGGIFYGLGFYSYIAYRATPLLILIIIVLYWFQIRQEKNAESNEEEIRAIKKKILFSVFCFLISAFIVAAPLGFYFLKNPQDFFGRTSQISVFNSLSPFKDLTVNILKTAGMFNFSGDWNWRHNYAGRPQLFWPIGIIFLIGVFLAVKFLIQNSKLKIKNDNSKLKNEFQLETDVKILRFPFLIIISWLIIAAIPVIVSNEGLPHALRAILMIPPVFILAGIGGFWVYEKIKNQISNQNSIFLNFIIRILFFIILSLLIFEAYNTYFIKWEKNPNTIGAFNQNYVEIGRQLNSLPKEMLKYIIVEAGGVDVRGIPMPAQTIMFITDTFTPEKQKKENIYYILPKDIDKIPTNAYVVVIK